MAQKPPAIRCTWADGSELMQAYHDQEWGVPQHDARMLWEMLMLEGFQAGLSWHIVLRKRDAFRKAFAGFDPVKVARFKAVDVERLMQDEGIIRARPPSRARKSTTRCSLMAMTSVPSAGRSPAAR